MVDIRVNRYARSPETLEKLTRECVRRSAGANSELAILELRGDDEVSDLARHVERELFDRAFGKTVPHTPDLMTQEYGPYEQRSTFFMALDVASGTPVGVLRIVAGQSKSLNDLRRADLLTDDQVEAYGFDSSTMWDVATAAVTRGPNHRTNRAVPLTLYRALYVAAQSYGITHWTSVIEAKVLGAYEHLGIPFQRFGEVPQLKYLGSDAIACHCSVHDVRSSMASRAERSDPETALQILAILDGSDLIPELSLSETIDLTEAPSEAVALDR